MSREQKPIIYYLARRGWHDSLIRFCDQIMAKKGKDPTAVFWKAYALGMNDNFDECRRQLEGFASRRDLQFPATMALIHFGKRQQSRGQTHVDHEYLDGLMSEMSVAEDVAKEAGLVLSARFSLFTGDLDTATAISQRLLQACRGNPSTPFEMEAQVIDCWAAVQEAQAQIAAATQGSAREGVRDVERLLSTTIQRKLQSIDDLVRGRSDQFDVDMLMLHATSLSLRRAPNDAILASYNQMIAAYPWFVPALTHKAALLARSGDWEHALDAAQRALDAENDNFDALSTIAVHAFTQESQPHDALSKFEDLVRVLQEREPTSVTLAVETAALFSSICARQPRALQMCAKLLEKAKKHSRDDEECAKLLVQLGHVHVLQGILAYESAMSVFKEASKLDPNSVAALEGMILCQLSEGLFEDAEGQIELLAVMHSVDELSPEFYYLKAMLAKYHMSELEKSNARAGHEGNASHENLHLACLNDCRERFLARVSSQPDHLVLCSNAGGGVVSARFSPFNYLIANSSDFLMCMAVDYLGYTDSGSITLNLFGKAGSKPDAVDVADGQAELESTTLITGMTGAGMTMIGGTGLASPTRLTKAGKGARAGGQANSQAQQQVVEMPPPVLVGMELLNRTLKQCPGMTCTYIELARTYMHHSMYEEAVRTLHQCLSLNPHCSAALLFMSQIEVKRFDTPAANRAVEQALSCDFNIRTSTLFRLVRAMVRAQQGALDESLTDMEELMNLPEVRSSNPMDALGLSDPSAMNSVNSSGNGHANVLRLTDDDRVGAFIIYASLLSKARRTKEASKILSEARAVFAGQAQQEVQLLVASSQLAVERKDFDSAIRQLDKIGEDSPTFAKAQMIKAEILLTNNRDKEGYTKCFQLLVERDPHSAKSYSMLGEAFLRILNPEAAVEALETAYKLDPSNGRLRGRIGRALVATHEYHRAVDFYESAIKDVTRGLGAASPGESGSPAKNASSHHMSSEVILLSHDLAKLYIKLGRIQQSQRVLQRILHEKESCQDITDLKQNVTTLLLLSEIQCSDQALSAGVAASQEERTANMRAGVDTLRQTYEHQKEVLSQSRGTGKSNHGNTGVEREREMLSDICEKIATLEEELEPSEFYQVADTPEGGRVGKLNRKVEEMYNEALMHNPHNTQAMLGLARVNKKAGDLDRCRTHCQKIILSVDTHTATGAVSHMDSLEDEAAILLSEVLFLKATAKTGQMMNTFDDDDEIDAKGGADLNASKGDIQEFKMIEDDDEDEGKKGEPSRNADSKKKDAAKEVGKAEGAEETATAAANLSGAVKPLETVLNKHPNNYKALERAISLLRRLGRLEEVPAYLTAAASNDGRAATHAGYHYCQGLYARFTNDVGKAIAEFNMARRDETWGPDALVAMIELYLNPNQDGAWEEREAGPMDDSLSNNLNAAEVLLKELKPKAQAGSDAGSSGGIGVSMLRFRVLENYYLLATRLKSNVEKVMQSFISMLETDPDYLPAVLGMATGFMVEKNSHKARNLLKRVAKLEPSRHDGEDFSKANLLLAKFYVDKSKYDQAQDLCKRTLNQNKSSSQAWEILGLVMEKEQSYDRAAECYERAWKLEFEASAPVGFKLASCYMKAKPARYVDAIDVCEKVLGQYPDYPRIREEILRKCMENVKCGEAK